VSKKQRELLVSSLLADLNLTKVKKSRVGTTLNRGISGGERRRLSIAVEMVTGPKIVFLDEPTTGLDSHNALRVMTSLKNLCRKHHVTIVCTVHQPRSNIFHLFDNVLLLDGGRTVYYGKNPVSYFSTLGLDCPHYMNPADFLLDIILQAEDETTEDNINIQNTNSLKNFGNISAAQPLLSIEEPSTSILDMDLYDDDSSAANRLESNQPVYTADELKEKFVASSTYEELMELLEKKDCHIGTLKNLDKRKVPRVSKFTQMRVLLSRTWRTNIRDSNVIYVRTFAAIFISLLVGIIFFQLPDDSSSNANRLNSILFLMCVFSLFCLPAISKFIEERLVYTREHASGYYSTLPYWISNFLCELPILLVTVLIYGSISYWMVGFEPGIGPFTFFLAVVFVVIQVAYSVCQVIAANVKTVNMAIAIYVLFLLYSLLLGGFLVHQDTLPENCQWLVYTSYFYYGFAALVVSEFENRSYGQSVISSLNLEDVNKYYNLAFLIFLWIALKFIEYICLRFFTKEKR